MRLLNAMIVLCLAHAVLAGAQVVPDACRAGIPVPVGRALTQRFRDHQLPLFTDSLPEDIEFNRTKGGNGCGLVASGDFDGDGQKDFAVGLTPKRGGAPLVVVALSRKGSWLMFDLGSWTGPKRLYVDTVPPGVYARTPALEGPVRFSERESLRCSHRGVVVGATESTEIVICLIDSQWLHVQISD